MELVSLAPSVIDCESASTVATQESSLTALFFYVLFASELREGMLFGMPDAFMRAKAKEALGIELPPAGEYAVANVFFPPENPEVLKDCKATMERLTRQRGLNVLGWRPVPVDNSMLGQDPLDSEPDTEQVRTHPEVHGSWLTMTVSPLT